MKKILALTTAAMLMLSAMSVTSYAGDGITLIVNGETVDFTGDQEPIIQNGRTLVPFRAAFEKMGAVVNWYSESNYCEATYDKTTVGIAINDTTVSLGDGSEIKSDVPAQIINSRTMVPLRVLSESIGAKVVWDADTKTITVTTPEIGGITPTKVNYETKMGTATGNTNVDILFSYPVITDTYTASALLNKNIASDVSTAIAEISSRSTVDAPEIVVDYSVQYNDSGLFSVMYTIDGEAVYWNHYAISTGSRISDDEFAKLTGDDIPDVTDVTIDDSQNTVSNVSYTIEEYTVNDKANDGSVCITGTTHYPQFDGMDGLNYQLQKSAMKGVDSFIASYKDVAVEAYENASDKLLEVPCEFVENCEVKIVDNIAYITYDFSERVYNKDVRTNESTLKIDLNTGLEVEE
jgi:hypothetical protein